MTTENVVVLGVQIVVGFVAGFGIQHFRLKARGWKRLYETEVAFSYTVRVENSRLNWEVMYLNRKIAVLEGEGWKQ